MQRTFKRTAVYTRIRVEMNADNAADRFAHMYMYIHGRRTALVFSTLTAFLNPSLPVRVGKRVREVERVFTFAFQVPLVFFRCPC